MAACSSQELNQSLLGEGCLDDATQRVQGVDWPHARIVPIRIRQGRYEPMIIRLLQDQAYIFRIKNDDARYRDFRAPAFFGAVAIESVKVNGAPSEEECAPTVIVPPNGTVEVRLVAVLDGRYEFEDQPVPIPGIISWGASGVISINPKASIPVARWRDLPKPPSLQELDKEGTSPAPAPSIFGEDDEEEGEDESEGGAPTKSLFDSDDEGDEEDGETPDTTTKSLFDSDDEEEGDEEEDGPDEEGAGEEGEEDESAGEEGEDGEEPEESPTRALFKDDDDPILEDEEEFNAEEEPDDEDTEDDAAGDDDESSEKRTASTEDKPKSLEEMLRATQTKSDEAPADKPLDEILRESEKVPEAPDEVDPSEEEAEEEGVEAAPVETKTTEKGAPTPDQAEPEEADPKAGLSRAEEGRALFNTLFNRVYDAVTDYLPGDADTGK